MTDDPFLAPPSQPGQQPQQPAQPPPYQPAAPAPYQPPAPAPYQQQAGYPPSMPPPVPYYSPQSKPKTWMNWAAFGCGIGMFATCISFIPAIVFGHLGLAAAKRGEADQRGAGIAGLVLGYVGLAGTIAFIALIAIAASSSDFQ